MYLCPNSEEKPDVIIAPLSECRMEQMTRTSDGHSSCLPVTGVVPMMHTCSHVNAHCWGEVAETEPVVKGQTAANSFKPAILDNGVKVMVPPFVGTDEDIIVNTESMEYSERA